MDASLSFIDLSTGDLAREDADRGAKPVAVLGRREGTGRVLHRADMPHGDVAIVGCVVDEVHVDPDMACACRNVALVQLHDDAHVFAVNHTGRSVASSTKAASPGVDREHVLDQGGERHEPRLKRRECRRLLRLRGRVDGGPGGDCAPRGA